MPGQAKILEYWRARRDENRRLVDSGTERLRWLRVIYVRVFDFLLAQYGNDAEAPTAASIDSSDQESASSRTSQHRTSRLYVAADVGEGLPKTAAQIRSTLKSVHAANDWAEQPGPLTDGLQPGSWIVVQTYRRRRAVELFCYRLRSAGIDYRCHRRARSTIVEVRMCDYNHASQLLVRARPGADRILPFTVYVWSGIFLGLVYGGFCGVICVRLFDAPLWLFGVFSVAGVGIGVFLARIRFKE